MEHDSCYQPHIKPGIKISNFQCELK